MQIKILHIFDHSLPLHSGYVFRSLAILREQRKRGWRTVHITTPRHTVAKALVEKYGEFEFYRTMQKKSVLSNLPVVADLHQMWLTSKRIDTVIASEKPDILQASSPVLNALPALWSARRHNLPVIYEVRAFWEDAAVTAGATREGSARYKMTRAMETYALRRVDAVTTICEGLRNDIIGRGVAESDITVIPNAVDVETFKTDVQYDTELAGVFGLAGKTVLGFIGSFYAYEGLDLVISALPELSERIPNIALLLVGGGPMEEELRAQSIRLGVADRVIFTGRVPQTEVGRYYGLVNLLVYARYPTRLTELVTPLKPLEAMAQKRPFLASNVGGHKELISDNETGFLFQAGDKDDLTDKIVEILADEERLPRILEAGRRFVETKRNWGASVAGYQGVFDRLLGR